MDKKYKNNSTPAFTLVELIVVITIVWILSTIGFVSYSNYLTGARDGNRISQMVKLSDALQVYASKNSLPLPDNAINITASWTIISYQGYVGENVLETIDFSNGGKDPKDDSYFTYYLTKDRKKMQLLAYMEENQTASLLNQSYAADYENRYPKVYGQKLWVLIWANDNIPLQEISWVSGTFEHFTNTWLLLSALFSDIDILTWSGYTMYGLSTPKLGSKAPTDCPTGFIGVPGNPEFNTIGFCVAQYEMTYTDADTPNSTVGGTDWNTVSYVAWKQIVSMAGKYPIADINQTQAIAACQSMGAGYHLITNDEWMTIARSIEANPENWSSGTVWVWSLWNGVSNNTTYGCNAKGGNTETRTYATKTGAWESSCNPRRSHTLTNGQTIWDLSGNVWEHVNKANTIDGTGYNTGQTAVSWSSAPTLWDNDGIYGTDMQRYGSATGLGTTGGMGNLYYGQGVASNTLLRGGSADSGANAGVFTLILSNASGSAYRGVGFRCAK